MEVIVHDAIRERPELAAVVSRAIDYLQTGLTRSAAAATADWSLSRDDRGGPVLVLKIAEPEGAVEGRFIPSELADDFSMQSRLSRLWDRLLANRIERSLDRTRLMLEEIESQRN